MVDREHFDEISPQPGAGRPGPSVFTGTYTRITRDKAGTHVHYRDKGKRGGPDF